METLRSWGIELQQATINVLPSEEWFLLGCYAVKTSNLTRFPVCLHSVVLVTVRVKQWECGTLLRFGNKQIVGAPLAGVMCNSSRFLHVSRATVSHVALAYRNPGNTSAKRNRRRKISIYRGIWSYIQKDCFEETESCTCTSESRAEYSSMLVTLFPPKYSDVSFRNQHPR
jgi:hypothetical protein